jgi:predicted RNase H-like nuclease (RuvC/YqgF family)
VHILTKVFVLFAAVLSILMAALSISYTVNADRVVADYTNALASADQARNDRDAVKASSSQLIAAKEEELNASREELASRSADIRRLEAANTELRINLRSAEAARESITTKIAELGVAVETQAKIIDEYKNELSRLRRAELDYRDERLDLEKQLSDLESQVIVYEQVKRALEEQLQEIRTALATARSGGAVGQVAGGEPPSEIQGSIIRGSISEVMNDPATGQRLVKINLGTNDRLRPNTRLFVHRGQTYLGELVVFEVDLNHAIGRVAYAVAGETIRSDDSVMSRLGN